MSVIAKEQHPWITNELFENILKANGSANATVIDFVLNEAVAKGANYGSQMIRVFVNYTDGSDLKNKTFIVKTGFSNVPPNVMLLEIFRREMIFYRDILPQFQKYQHKIDPNFKCAPKCYQLSEDPLYFVFEDLREQEFSNLDRYDGLSFDAGIMVIRKLAVLHAINAKLYEDDPVLFEPYKTPALSGENGGLVKTLSCGLRDIQQVCLNWPGYEQYSDNIKRFLDNITKKMNDAFEADNDDTFTTLTHGDLWVNNIMYKFDETSKNPVDVIMVDYQLGYCGSPVLDLIYLLHTSMINEVREREWDRLVQFYHAELIRSLKLIECRQPMPTLNELQIQILKRSPFGVIMAFILFRFVDDSDHANIEMLMGNSEDALKIRYRLFEKPKVKERIQYLLEFFGRKGFFE